MGRAFRLDEAQAAKGGLIVGEFDARAKGEPPKPLTTEEVLTRLEKGEITFDEAMALIKTTKGS